MNAITLPRYYPRFPTLRALFQCDPRFAMVLLRYGHGEGAIWPLFPLYAFVMTGLSGLIWGLLAVLTCGVDVVGAVAPFWLFGLIVVLRSAPIAWENSRRKKGWKEIRPMGFLGWSYFLSWERYKRVSAREQFRTRSSNPCSPQRRSRHPALLHATKEEQDETEAINERWDLPEAPRAAGAGPGSRAVG